jgi:hypothetical protein
MAAAASRPLATASPPEQVLHDSQSSAALAEAAERWHRVAQASADLAQETRAGSEAAAVAASSLFEAGKKAPDILDCMSRSFTSLVDHKCRALLQCTKQVALATPPSSLLMISTAATHNDQRRGGVQSMNPRLPPSTYGRDQAMASCSSSWSSWPHHPVFHELGVSRWVERSLE